MVFFIVKYPIIIKKEKYNIEETILIIPCPTEVIYVLFNVDEL